MCFEKTKKSDKNHLFFFIITYFFIKKIVNIFKKNSLSLKKIQKKNHFEIFLHPEIVIILLITI